MIFSDKRVISSKKVFVKDLTFYCFNDFAKKRIKKDHFKILHFSRKAARKLKIKKAVQKCVHLDVHLDVQKTLCKQYLFRSLEEI